MSSSPASDPTSPPHGTPIAPSAELEALRRALGGTYDVERLLGAGGMGSVYLGRDVTLDRPVAIKVIVSELAASPALRERFLREARTVARLRHPNVVAVYAAGEAEGLLYFVMEYVPGESLRDRLERNARYDDAGGIAALRDLARALGYAHAQGIVHRDVKPENVLLDAQTGRAMLTDFGVARAFDAAGADERMTGTGFVVGSPRYMSPEQAAGERELDGRSDVYSLGLIGYEMFAGEPAVAGGSAASIIMRQITERPAPLLARNGAVPPAVASVVERALEKRPDDRWPTGAEMADALDAALHDPQARTASLPSARPPSAAAAPAPRRRALVAGLALAAVAVVGGGGWWMARGSAGALGGADPRKSYLVAPFDVLSPDPQLAWLREGAVSMLSLDLAQWRDLKVIDYERGLDLQRDLKLDGRRIGREDAIRMARRAGVGSVVTGRVTGTPDSTLVLATVYDVASGSKVDSAQRSAPRGADPRALFDALARDLLDLVGAPAGTQALAQSVTSSVEAYRDYLEASRALNAWQLPRADSLFGAAISADSTFALAYYKRALTYGWWKAGDTTQLGMIRQATRNAGRLPARERGLLDAYAAFATAMYGGTDVPDSVRNARFTDAERKYAAALTRDSADAEAWYGLADAYYHHQTGNWGDSTTRDHWTRALAGFNRTLALDSSFHLAYSHKVNIYQQAAAPNSPLVLDGEVLRSLNDAATRQTFQGARLTAAKRRAQELGVREARAWAAADPVPPAFFAVAQAYLPAHWDSAAAALDDAVQRLGPREAGILPFAYASVAARTDPLRARDALHAALQTDSASLARAGGSDRFQFIVASMQVAAMTGALRDLDVAARLAAAAQPSIPGTRVPTSMIVQWWAAGLKLAAGAPSASVRPAVDGGLGGLDAMPGRFGESARRQSMLVPYVALLVTREPKYLAMVTKWAGGDAGAWPEAEALAALGAGDSARARAATSRFPSPDSMRAGTSAMNAARWVARAEVLAALGDAPRALAMYEVLDPRRFGDVSVFDPGLVLWARSYLARGRLYEQLGQRPQAAAAYDRFVTLWKDADPSLQPQVREARAGLARVRDQGAGQVVR